VRNVGFIISEDRANPCLDDGHDVAATTATHGWSLSDPCQRAIGIELSVGMWIQSSLRA